MSILVFKPTLLKSFHKRVKDRDKNLGLQNENQHLRSWMNFARSGNKAEKPGPLPSLNPFSFLRYGAVSIFNSCPAASNKETIRSMPSLKRGITSELSPNFPSDQSFNARSRRFARGTRSSSWKKLAGPEMLCRASPISRKRAFRESRGSWATSSSLFLQG